ncbi:MAG: hypothetical protein V5783_11170 [Pontiella sp.]
MKVLNNIILMIALLLVALPCMHRAEHHQGASFRHQADQISAMHVCASCYTCESDSICTEALEVKQTLTLSSAVAPVPAPMIQLFVLNQKQRAFKPISPPVSGPYIGLKTIQLLI